MGEIVKVKQWLDNVRPTFEVIDWYSSVRRIKDGVIFNRFDCYYEYQIINGVKYTYDITSFSHDKKRVEIRIQSNGKFVKQTWININYLNKKI